MSGDFRPMPFFILRTPLLPFETIVDWSAAGPDDAALTESLLAIARRPEIVEALELASDALAAELRQPQPPRRVLLALARYVVRAAARPTPFGLFAGYSLGRVGEATALELPPAAAYQRRTELGIESIEKLLAQFFRDPRRAAAPLVVTSTLYEAGNQLRYIEERGREHALRAVRGGRELRRAVELAREGLTAAQLTERLASELGAAQASVARFVEQLVANQLLLPDVQPRVTADDPLADVAARLRAADPARAALLDAAGRELRALDAQPIGGGDYTRLREQIEAIAPGTSPASALHVVMRKPAPALTLGEPAAQSLFHAADVLRRMFGDEESDSLQTFRERFLARYEMRFVPLLEALDEELGAGFAGYGNDALDDLPLLRDVHFPAKPRLPRWRPAHRVLLPKAAAAGERGETEIELSEADVERMSAEDVPPFPESIAAMVTLCGGSRALLHSVFGPSGAQVVGRFCHGDPQLIAEVREWLREEQRMRPDAVFAEVVMLPDGRDANVVVRPALYDYEIPFLGHASVPPERQIAASDLLIGARGGRFVLWSKSLDREVVPRVTTAHNLRALGVSLYRLVGAMQRERFAGNVSWIWGPLAELPFLPRVRFRDVIFSRARWRVAPEELEPLRRGSAEERLAAARALVGRRRMPRFMLLVDGDNELAVDWTNIVMIDAFTAIAHERGAVLDEMLPAPGELPVRGPEGRFTNEILLPFVRKQPAERRWKMGTPASYAVTRAFPPGSEWLFLKIYCGYATEDRLIAETILPAMRRLRAEGKMDGWFFIRFLDPEMHLRLRVHGAPEVLWSSVYGALRDALAPALESGAVSRLQLDTYTREIERYGGAEGIRVAEALFEADSETVAEVMPFMADAELRWQLAAYGSDRLLEDCGLGFDERVSLLHGLCEDFGREYGNDRALRDDLARKNRAVRPKLDALFAGAASQPWFAAYEERSRRTRPLVARLRAATPDAPFDEIAGSYLHMHLNRVFRFVPRRQERVLYDVLHRRYLSGRARQAMLPR
jgi:lantibiotic biosynthesis protein